MTLNAKHIEGLHVLTDERSPLSFVTQAIQAAENGACVLQLRDKKASDAEMISQGEAILKALSPYRCKLIINDRLEVALKIKAHGLHVGQKDGNIADIRRKIGHDMILGLSISEKGQLSHLPQNTVDYIGVGPLRATSSKKDHDLPLGFEGVHNIIAASQSPAIIIGGVTISDLPFLKKAGAKGIAVISAISQDENPSRAVSEFSEMWQNMPQI